MKWSDFLLSPVPTNDPGTTDDVGATLLFIAVIVQTGQLEFFRYLVEFGANKDEGWTNDEATPFYIAAQNGQFEIDRFFGSP